ncbi:MAG: PfkB family carbohydrate kinase [Bacteroidota bacterium]
MVYCIGETVLDIIFQEGRPIAAKPGGSMLNSAISLGRSGVPVHFISDFAKDQPGDLIWDFLLQNQVGTDYIDRIDGGKTALALAFLDKHHDADYSFYKMFPKKRLNISFPVIEKGDIILFGSYYALTGDLRKRLISFIRNARSKGAYILYDPNFRKSHLAELEKVKPWIIENVSLSSMVRGSDEDFRHIFGVNDENSAFIHLSEAGCQLLVYTKNKENVEVVSKKFHRSFKVKPINPLSTIGAGDAFNAGIIYAASNLFTKTGNSVKLWEVDPKKWPWDDIIDIAIGFASNVCQSLDNYISIDYAGYLKTNNH